MAHISAEESNKAEINLPCLLYTSREQKTVMTIDQALDAEQKTVRLEEAAGAESGDYAVSYTHLDVYKRQL